MILGTQFGRVSILWNDYDFICINIYAVTDERYCFHWIPERDQYNRCHVVTYLVGRQGLEPCPTGYEPIALTG